MNSREPGREDGTVAWHRRSHHAGRAEACLLAGMTIQYVETMLARPPRRKLGLNSAAAGVGCSRGSRDADPHATEEVCHARAEQPAVDPLGSLR
jgi:hypothetical protein